MDPIDDTVLADFLAGRLSPARRAEVIRHLAANESSRELLRMAYLAQEASRTEERGAQIHVLPRRLEEVPAAPAKPRFYTLRNVSRIAAAIALLLGAGVVFRLTLGPPADPVRNRTGTEQTLALEARISPRSLAITWHAVPGADHYEVMVWDEEAVREVASERVTEVNLPADGPFAAALRARMERGRRYALRVRAFDATNRQLVASDLTAFRYEGE